MTCTCPEGYITDDDRGCKTLPPIVSGCETDDTCSESEACINAVCKDPCACGLNAVCNVINHRPVCICKVGIRCSVSFVRELKKKMSYSLSLFFSLASTEIRRSSAFRSAALATPTVWTLTRVASASAPRSVDRTGSPAAAMPSARVSSISLLVLVHQA